MSNKQQYEKRKEPKITDKITAKDKIEGGGLLDRRPDVCCRYRKKILFSFSLNIFDNLAVHQDSMVYHCEN